MPKPTVPCTRPWCDAPSHVEGAAHFAPLANFPKDATDVSIDLGEHEPSGGPLVLVSLHIADEEGCLDLDLAPSTAYALAQVIAALDSAVVLQFTERLAFAAVTLSPDLAVARFTKALAECAPVLGDQGDEGDEGEVSK